MCRMRQDPTHTHVVATCGKENALKVWDLQGSEEPVFRAKNVSDKGWGEAMSEVGGSEHNLDELEGLEETGQAYHHLVSHIYLPHQVRNDWLDLRVPIWDQDIQFLPGSQKLVTCTGYHQVRFFATPELK